MVFFYFGEREKHRKIKLQIVSRIPGGFQYVGTHKTNRTSVLIYSSKMNKRVKTYFSVAMTDHVNEKIKRIDSTHVVDANLH